MRKKLGQHFLHNKAALQKIVDALSLHSGEIVIEVGPGHGELTEFLLRSDGIRVIGIEKDPALISTLREKFKDTKSFESYEGDVRTDLLSIIARFDSYKLVGNIPYYLTGFLFRIISELPKKPDLIVLTIQKEVAERVCAEPPEMNLLAASIQVWAEPKILGVLERSDFSPPPEVDSAILELAPRKREEGFDDVRYFRFIKALFKQPRKMILNNLRDGFTLSKEDIEEKLKKFSLSSSLRPQDLSIEELVELSTVFS
ncbi:MAG: ribosomal RNA small subunit methyltransferase A [Candidatus Colwellbacteria bacterium RIFCSPLOWO2_12_FULL_44_13]|uniref:Ribosomal RNA small subunit methyltransferase A n=1 Tax=Candidatus Colwellbacteria bacterium RIFCSPLOWO2_12_FULL_44_13 TaxID=1797694 RepID=A0A1G1ZA23_9BACT|nr:MAG: ribosomal RNA small subunit methyltransferase A [Candidatus Colwellbacteria bacterium RIFCSPLOWO2_12_FULL_44_13]